MALAYAGEEFYEKISDSANEARRKRIEYIIEDMNEERNDKMRNILRGHIT